MFNHSKFLPVLALAAALSPFAATARTVTGPDQSSQQYLEGNFNAAPQAQGRSAEANHPAGLFTIDYAAHYALVNTGVAAN